MLANKVGSFTQTGKEYAIIYDGEKWICDCMDFKIRGGSHHISYTDPENKESGDIITCKHIAQFLADNGATVWELFEWGSKKEIKKRKQ